jgi:hypothetical protein
MHRHCNQIAFKSGMVALKYPGNSEGLFEDMLKETGEMDELALEDIDEDQAMMWNKFRRWCGAQFSNARDLIRQCKQEHRRRTNHHGAHHDDEILHEEEFVQGLLALGWDCADSHGDITGFEMFESNVFGFLDWEREGCIGATNLKFLDHEVRRHRQKAAAKRRAQRIAEHRAQGTQAMQAALLDFKDALRRHAGSLFKAWRKLLDPDGSMTVQRADLFKVCQKLNWKGDVRALWKALDHDNSHVTTLEELDPHGAQLLAQFKAWAVSHYGPKPAAAMFRTLDKQNLRKVRYAQFVHEVQARGFDRKAKAMVPWLDWEDKRWLHEEDFTFLDHWKPPAWLVAKPSEAAANDFKRHLLDKYRHPLKAWRGILDKDNSNCCNWHEFQEAAKHLRFTGDVAGAWLHFDQDISGYITLKDRSSSKCSVGGFQTLGRRRIWWSPLCFQGVGLRWIQ